MKILLQILIFVNFFTGFLWAQVNLDSGLVAYYKFDGNANDESGNGNDGVIYGANLVEDRFGSQNSAFEFDGIDDYINIGQDSSLRIEGSVSISAWVNFSEIQEPLAGIITDGSGFTPRNYIIYLNHSGLNNGINDSNVSFSVYDNITWTPVTSTDEFNDSLWHHIVGIRNIQSDSSFLYIDGSLDIAILDNTTGQISTSGVDRQIGRYLYNSGADISYFNGLIDDIRIYNRSLNLNEIDALFNETITSIELVNPNLPYKSELLQNYPNPFNPTTKILFSIQNPCFVTLKVYDVLGRETQILVKEFMNSGSYTIDFDAVNLSSGIYFYRLQADSFIAMKKMLLVR